MSLAVLPMGSRWKNCEDISSEAMLAAPAPSTPPATPPATPAAPAAAAAAAAPFGTKQQRGPSNSREGETRNSRQNKPPPFHNRRIIASSSSDLNYTVFASLPLLSGLFLCWPRRFLPKIEFDCGSSKVKTPRLLPSATQLTVKGLF